MANYVFDIADLPLDEWNGEDEDDYLAHGQDLPIELEKAKRELTSASPKSLSNPKTIYVPLKRNVKFGTRGNDAFAVKRALAKAGYGKWGAWGKYSKLFYTYSVRRLRTFQQQHHQHVDGVYGPSTHRKLAPYYDAYGRYLMGTIKTRTVATKRARVVNAAMFGYQHRASIHYTQSASRMYGVRHRIKPPRIPIYEDCSSFATWCYWIASAADPNGLGYNGAGYTGTLIHHGRRVSASNMKPGDLVFYGRYSIPSHVAIYVGSGRVVSHGSEVGPLLISWNYRGDVHSIRSYL